METAPSEFLLPRSSAQDENVSVDVAETKHGNGVTPATQGLLCACPVLGLYVDPLGSHSCPWKGVVSLCRWGGSGSQRIGDRPVTVLTWGCELVQKAVSNTCGLWAVLGGTSGSRGISKLLVSL